MLQLQEMSNKQVKQYKCLFSESGNKQRAQNKTNAANKKRKERKRIKHTKLLHARLEANKKHIKNLSNKTLTRLEFNLQKSRLQSLKITCHRLNVTHLNR